MNNSYFINNHGIKNHRHNLIRLLEDADEVWIATAFLKTSGLRPLLPSIKKLIRSGININIIAGQNFGFTEPSALNELRTIFLKSPNAKLFIAHALKANEVFHPKLYLFRTGKKAFIVAGSANVTEGGLSKNTECSLMLETDINNTAWRDSLLYFEKLLSPDISEEATLLSIKRYESFYDKQKRHNRNSKAIPKRNKKQQNFNYENLLSHFKSFNNNERQQVFKDKTQHYTEAKGVLDTIADSSNLNESEFSKLLEKLVGTKGQARLWHSGSLFRLRRKIYPNYIEFRNLVRMIRRNVGEKPSDLFTKAKDIVVKIHGAGANYITEIMMTYDPMHYADLNNNPITVLRKEGDVNVKSSPNEYSGDDYEDFCELVLEISNKLGLRNMLEADSFFNDIYWKIK